MISLIYTLIELQERNSHIYYVEDKNPPSELHPAVEQGKKHLVAQASERGIDVVITEGVRTKQEQERLYEQGRSTEGDIVTYASGGQSYHNYGLAIDFALQLDDGDVVWDLTRDDNGNGQADWMEVVEIAKGLGFAWGGDWQSFKDYPHLQMDFGLSIRELQRGKRPKPETLAEE
ncbi:M15 family metallopeptidase [Halobacillus shinanisalinarum]|uniref:M15 family metallopeptidase n=1 Tax=Halobacillus shinanisalinarum TaxID=2932258 RepID=A0ABY4H9S8_9BACI|nr:M15 family metallopeptidase [Halobacillus shinanisalinarum]UOQ95752.1 M15 family metallopeptidase [Halobacillus shinanisalinarum]